MKTAERQSAKMLELRAAMSLASLLAGQGMRRRAGELLAPVYGWFTEGHNTPDMIEAKSLVEGLN
jgi:predicted ATPase